MKKISRVYLKNGRNAEYYLLCQNMLAAVTEEFATSYAILHIYRPYADLVAKVSETYLQNQQFADTKGINEADAMSDIYMSMFKSMLNSYKLWPEAAKQGAYETLYYIAKPYWGASSKPIAENIAMVKDLVVALRADGAKAAVALLGLDSVVDKLEEANNECNKRYLLRADERLQRSLADKMKNLRRQTDEAFYLLAEVISSLYVVYSVALKDEAKAAELEGVIDKVNAILLEYTLPISRRGGSGKANVDPGTVPPGASTGGGDDERPGEL